MHEVISAVGFFATVAFVVGLGGFLVATSRKHDPSRARAACALADDGSFTLQFANPRGPVDVFLRYHIGGAAVDEDHDVAIGAELSVDGRPTERVEWRTGGRAPVLGYATPREVQDSWWPQVTLASIFVVRAPRGGVCTVRGVARAGGDTRLRGGWIYVPR